VVSVFSRVKVELHALIYNVTSPAVQAGTPVMTSLGRSATNLKALFYNSGSTSHSLSSQRIFATLTLLPKSALNFWSFPSASLLNQRS